MNIRSLLAVSLLVTLSFAGCGRKKCCPVEASQSIQQELNEFIETDETEEIIISQEAGNFK